ncbi:MAG: class I SAM-dependent methyltransferase [Demequina sp.]
MSRDGMPTRNIRSIEDLLFLMDDLFERDSDRWSAVAGADWWDAFYEDRARPVPFFADKPDENLVAILDSQQVTVGRALDLGCGPGRNALALAQRGFTVDAVDLSPRAVGWGSERAAARGLDVSFVCGDAFTLPPHVLTGPYDLVYDSGCLHHLAPHRRIGYLDLLDRVLAPGGFFGLACFARGQMGSEVPDAQMYRDGRFEAGMSFSEDDLRWIFDGLDEVEIRPMVHQDRLSPLFGQEFLLTALFRKPGARRRRTVQ